MDENSVREANKVRNELILRVSQEKGFCGEEGKQSRARVFPTAAAAPGAVCRVMTELVGERESGAFEKSPASSVGRRITSFTPSVYKHDASRRRRPAARSAPPHRTLSDRKEPKFFICLSGLRCCCD